VTSKATQNMHENIPKKQLEFYFKLAR